MTRTLLGLSLLGGPTLFILLLPASRAQADVNDLLALSLYDLARVSVSSTSYVDEAILDAANSVSYRDQQNWREIGARNLSELLNTLPSTLVPTAYGTSQPLAIRGYYSYNSNLGIALRLDDVPLNQLSSGSGLSILNGYDLNALQSIELIRGPGSALHGAGAFQGTLSLYSASAGTDETETTLAGGTREYRSAALRGSQSGESVDVSAIIAHSNTGDQALAYPYNDPLTQQTQSGQRRQEQANTNVLLKVASAPYGDTQYSASLYLLDYDADQLIGTGNEFGDSYQNDHDWSQSSNRTQIAKLGLDHTFSSRHSLKTFAYYWQTQEQFGLDLLSERNLLRGTDREERHWGFQITDQLQFKRRSKLVYGYEYRYADVNKFEQYNQDQTGNRSTVSVEEQMLDEVLNSLILDGRYTLPLGDFDTDVVYSVRLDDFNRFDLQTSPRIGLIHYINRNAVVKFTLSQAYRKPTPREQVKSIGIAANPSLEPEQLNSMELSYQWSTSHWLSSITLFQNQWKHAIGIASIAIPGVEEEFQFQNKGNQEAYGVEFETQGQWDKWRLDVNSSFIQSSNEDTGIDYEAFPDWMLNVGVGYRLLPNLDLYSITRFHHRRSASTSSLLGNTGQPSAEYLRSDVVMSWTLNTDLMARFSLHNLFDRKNYYPSYFGHHKGLPDSELGVTMALDWQF